MSDNQIMTASNFSKIAKLIAIAVEPMSLQLSENELIQRIKKQDFIEITDNAKKETTRQLALQKAYTKLSDINISDCNETLKTLNKILQIFFLRPSHQERDEIIELQAVKDLYKKTYQLMKELEFIEVLYPKVQKKYFDLAIVWGGLEHRVNKRIAFLEKLVAEGYTFDRIVFLGGDRELMSQEPSLKVLTELKNKYIDYRLPQFHQLAFNEYDMMLYNCYQSGKMNDLSKKNISSINTEEIFKKNQLLLTTAPRARNVYIISFTNKNGIVLDFVNSPKLKKTGRNRPTTPSTIEDYLAYLLSNGLTNKKSFSVCSISMQPHAQQQASVARGVLPQWFDISATGEQADNVNTSDLLDNFGRYIYQEYHNNFN